MHMDFISANLLTIHQYIHMDFIFAITYLPSRQSSSCSEMHCFTQVDNLKQFELCRGYLGLLSTTEFQHFVLSIAACQKAQQVCHACFVSKGVELCPDAL